NKAILFSVLYVTEQSDPVLRVNKAILFSVLYVTEQSDPVVRVNKAIQAWLTAGIPKDKLVVGLATYGRGVRLNSAQFHNIGDFYSRQLASAGPYTGIDGVMAYYEICQKLSGGWSRVYVSESEVPLAYSNYTLDWMCYDDPQSFRAKAMYIVEQDLAGAMIWSLDFDDFTSQACNNGKYPLISQVKDVFRLAGKPPVSPTRTPTLPTLNQRGMNTTDLGVSGTNLPVWPHETQQAVVQLHYAATTGRRSTTVASEGNVRATSSYKYIANNEHVTYINYNGYNTINVDYNTTNIDYHGYVTASNRDDDTNDV
ncbi:hypothetical protein BaRGS_00036487, partial [Batillaria attramentaria]